VQPCIRIELALQDAGEGVKVDRLALGALGRFDKRVELDAGQRVGFRQACAQFRLLAVLQHAVGVDHMEHQRRGGQARIVGRGRAVAAPGIGQALQEQDQAVEHVMKVVGRREERPRTAKS